MSKYFHCTNGPQNPPYSLKATSQDFCEWVPRSILSGTFVALISKH